MLFFRVKLRAISNQLVGQIWPTGRTLGTPAIRLLDRSRLKVIIFFHWLNSATCWMILLFFFYHESLLQTSLYK